jgi:prolyl-tRNA synthetase
MKLSQYYIPTLKEAPKDADILSAKLMFRAGLIRKTASGIYEWLPLGMRVLKKIEQIIREELNAAGCHEIWLPIVQPKELWEQSGRWAHYGKELLRFKDRKDAQFCLAPTAEEVITDLVKKDISSYKQLPICLYQFGTKFRDEIRPRFGIMRAREFYMKDAYSFCADERSAGEWYQKLYDAYTRIFTRCGFKFKAVEADNGVIGGSFSHEFMVLAETGENQILTCQKCEYSASAEKVQTEEGKEAACPKCGGQFSSTRGIEVGHTFKLGVKYSQAMNAMFLDEKQQALPFIMGCYGIGVSRVLAAAIEQSRDENGIIWPAPLAPFDVILISLDAQGEVKAKADEVYEKLARLGYDVLYDDRDERAGIKFKDADLIGIPRRIVIGKKLLAQGKLEYKARLAKDAEFWAFDELEARLKA